MLILTKFIKKLYTSTADLISKIIPVDFQTPTVSISKSVIGIKQQEFMNKSKEAILTQELIYIQTSPCIFNTHKLSTRIESLWNCLHQELSDIKTKLVALESLVVDQIYMVRKKYCETPIAEDPHQSPTSQLPTN